MCSVTGEGSTASQSPANGEGAEVPLSARQKLLWLDEQHFPNARYHNLVLRIDLRGPLEVERLERAWLSTVGELDALRLAVDNGQPRQWLVGELVHRLSVKSLSPGDIDDWIAVRAGCSLRNGRFPWEAVLLRIAPDCHVFCLFIHQLVLDSPSAAYLVEHFADRYMGREPALSDPFAKYLAAEAEYRASPEYAQDRVFWNEWIASGAPPLRPYGLIHTDPSAGLARVSEVFGKDHASFLLAMAEGEPFRTTSPGLSRAILLATASAAFLHRVTGNREVVLGLPLADRGPPFSRTCGQLAQQILLRVGIDDGDTFASLGGKIKSAAEQAASHSRFCVEAQGLDFVALSLLPAFPTRFGDLDATVVLRAANTFPGVAGGIGDKRGTLGLHLADLADGTLEIGWDFHRGTFRDTAMTRANAHFLRMLDELVQSIDTSISGVDLPDEAERAQVMLASRGREPGDVATDLIEQLAVQTQLHSQKAAVVGPDATLTYSELEARSNQLARRLRACGVVCGARVAVAVPRGAGELVALLAILKAGGAYVPVDPLHPAERVRVILEDAGLHVLLASKTSPLLAEVPAGTLTIVLDGLALSLDGVDPSPLGERAATDQIAYVLFTSGSTGRPKGVEVLRSAFANFLRSMAHTPGLTEHDRFLAVTTTTFDIAGLELFLPLYVGATVLVADRETAADPRRLRASLETESVTIMQATPATWRLLIAEGWKGNGRLRMLCGGEAMSPDLARMLLARGSELWNLYGPTETTVWSTVERIQPDDERITIGRPIDGTQVYVLDTARRLVPVGVAGEIYIGGDGLARGYLGRDDLTSERFVPNPFGSHGSRIYRTGDLGRVLEDGRIECLGRVDYQVKIRGFRIELGEIETVLRAAPGVEDAVVVADTKDGGEAKLVAYFVGESDRAALFEHARGKLPSYMIPSAFVRLAEFPLTTSGKVDRKALPRAEAVPLAAPSGRLPQNDLERKVAAIWCEILGTKQMGVEENIFELGANSVSVVLARTRLEQEAAIKLPLRAFFENPTIAGQIRQIGKSDTTSPGEFRGLWQIRSGDEVLPVLLVHGDGADRFLPAHLPAEQSMYGYLHQGDDGQRLRYSTVESLAERCHAEWMEVCGDRACAIIGHSHGGLVAWHVAHLRRKAGLPVGALALIDTFHPWTERHKRWIGARGWALWRGQVRADIDHLAALARAELCFKRRQPIPLEQRNDYVLACYELAAAMYYPPCLDLDVLFFRAGENAYGKYIGEEQWRQSTKGRVDVHSVPGTHLGVMRSADAFEEIGRALAERIALARQREMVQRK